MFSPDPGCLKFACHAVPGGEMAGNRAVDATVAFTAASSMRKPVKAPAA
jgi:hypothetical protein